MAEKAAVDIARFIRSPPNDRSGVNVTLYKVLIAVREVSVERSVTLSFHKDKGMSSFAIL